MLASISHNIAFILKFQAILVGGGVIHEIVFRSSYEMHSAYKFM